MSWFSTFMHPGQPYGKAQDQIDKYYGQSNDFYNEGKGYQQPYNQWGQESHGALQEMLDKLKDPAALQNEWIKSYSESPAAQQAETQATQSGLTAAGQMGLGGSNTALQAIQGGASNIALADRQKYLDDLMTKYQNAAGIAGGLYNTGANAANTQSGIAAQQGANATKTGENSAQMAFNKQNAGGSLFSRLLGGAASGIAGGFLGGPAGAAAGVANSWNTSGGK